MKKFKRERILFDDINDYIPDEVNSFAQINLTDVLVLSPCLPPLGEILKVKAVPKITNTRIAKTATGLSMEGQKLTGWKYLVEGYCNVRADYFDTEKGGLIYTLSKSIPYNACVALPEDTSYHYKFIDNIYLEDVYSEIINNKELLVNISCLLVVEEY